MAKDENSIVFDIKNTKDIKQMQAKLNKLGMSEEKKYIALEFAENMIEANLTGSIKINDVYIINIVRACPKENVDTIKSFITKAKDMKKKNAVNMQDERGKGLLSILYADWDLNVEGGSKDFSIIARKNSVSAV
jgi:DNA-binding protein YbaB